MAMSCFSVVLGDEWPDNTGATAFWDTLRLSIQLSPAAAGSQASFRVILGLTPQALRFRLLRWLKNWASKWNSISTRVQRFFGVRRRP
jgi:hypothetical protein